MLQHLSSNIIHHTHYCNTSIKRVVDNKNDHQGSINNDVMDSNIIEEFRNIVVDKRTNEDYDSLLQTLELVWSHKVYQGRLLRNQEIANRELYDLSMSLAKGLIKQDAG